MLRSSRLTVFGSGPIAPPSEGSEVGSELGCGVEPPASRLLPGDVLAPVVGIVGQRLVREADVVGHDATPPIEAGGDDLRVVRGDQRVLLLAGEGEAVAMHGDATGEAGARRLRRERRSTDAQSEERDDAVRQPEKACDLPRPVQDAADHHALVAERTGRKGRVLQSDRDVLGTRDQEAQIARSIDVPLARDGVVEAAQIDAADHEERALLHPRLIPSVGPEPPTLRSVGHHDEGRGLQRR
jgi:ribosomal protein S28E/S33